MERWITPSVSSGSNAVSITAAANPSAQCMYWRNPRTRAEAQAEKPGTSLALIPLT
ncbi:hypothetical protein D3C76_1828580 [compost metagenome]